MIIKKSLADLLKLRRSYEMRNIIAPIINTIALPTGYKVLMEYGQFIYESVVDGEAISDFESDILPYCNDLNFPIPREPNTHNFADEDDFEIGTTDSTYYLCPNTNTRWILKRMEGKIDDGAVITATDSFNMAIWGSYDNTTACPAWANTRTSFATPLFNPMADPPVLTGWIESFYDQKQENKTWLHLTNGVPDYYVSHFEWKSVEAMKLKAEVRDIGSHQQSLSFDYQADKQFIQLRSSLNERMEFWIKNDAAYTAPNSKPIQASGTFDEYHEW